MAKQVRSPVSLGIAIERRCWHGGLPVVAGVDEVGRGALAGPLVAAAVIFPRDLENSLDGLAGLNDSKQLSARERDRWFDEIHQIATSIGVGSVECVEIDEIGLGPANRVA